MGRLIGALVGMAVLLSGVIFGQITLHNIATDLADNADAVCLLFSEKNEKDGIVELEKLAKLFDRRKKVLLLFLNDARVHELHRSVTRSLRLAKTQEWSPALEALSDFAAAMRELAETHHPTTENILKIHESFGFTA